MTEWELVNTNINSSILRGEGQDGKDSPIEQVLYLSYEDLPYYLKPCFLYLGILSEDECINALDIYERWIAQGMISYDNIQGKEQTLLEIAELYLSELASRCIVLVEVGVDISVPTLKYEACKLHDVIRELCVSIGTKENFGIQILEYQGGKFGTLLHEALSRMKTRHLVIGLERELQLEHDDHAIAYEENTCKHLRSLDIESHGLVDLQKFKMLKSLAIFGFKFAGRKLPRGITNLVHLKYAEDRSLQLCVNIHAGNALSIH